MNSSNVASDRMPKPFSTGIAATADATPWKSSVPNNLKMTGQVLARIYLGDVTKWDDAAIKALNPRVDLPSTSITPVFRSDNSGTSYNFTDYLSAVSPAWKGKIGIGVNANWPKGQGGRGSAGVSGIVSNTQGSIGYVDVAFALKNRLKFMSVKNASGRYTTPGLRGITAAAATVKAAEGMGRVRRSMTCSVTTAAWPRTPARSRAAC